MNFNLRALHVFSVCLFIPLPPRLTHQPPRGEKITPNKEAGGRKLAALSPNSEAQRLLWHGGSSPPIICERTHKHARTRKHRWEHIHMHTHTHRLGSRLTEHHIRVHLSSTAVVRIAPHLKALYQIIASNSNIAVQYIHIYVQRQHEQQQVEGRH